MVVNGDQIPQQLRSFPSCVNNGSLFNPKKVLSSEKRWFTLLFFDQKSRANVSTSMKQQKSFETLIILINYNLTSEPKAAPSPAGHRGDDDHDVQSTTGGQSA